MSTQKNVCRQTLVIMTGAAALGLAMLATGCGKFQTNPTADYGDVAKTAIPTEQQKQKRDRSYLGMVFPAPDTNGEILNFFEGDTKSYVINFRLLMGNVDYAIQTEGLPQGATLTPSSKGQPGDYILAWTPKVGTTNGEPMKNITVKVRLAVLKTYTTEAARVMNDINKEHKLVLTVVGSKEIPVIEKVEMPTDIINQGSAGETAVTIQKGGSVAFTVTVKDMSVTDGRAPQLYAAEEINGMNERALLKDASQHVVIDRNGKSLGKGLYQFTGRFSSEGVDVKDGKQIAARFALVPVSSRRGADKIIEIDIAAPAVVAAPTPAPAPVVAPAPTVSSTEVSSTSSLLPVVKSPVVKKKKETKKQHAVRIAAEKAAAKKAAKKAAAEKAAAAKSPAVAPAPAAASAPSAASAPAKKDTDQPVVQPTVQADKTGAKS